MESAVVYLRGHNQSEQFSKCEKHAERNNLDIIGIATEIDCDLVQHCKVVLVSSLSRISRNQFKFYEIKKKLNSKGIRIEVANQHFSIAEDEKMNKILKTLLV